MKNQNKSPYAKGSLKKDRECLFSLDDCIKKMEALLKMNNYSFQNEKLDTSGRRIESSVTLLGENHEKIVHIFEKEQEKLSVLESLVLKEKEELASFLWAEENKILGLREVLKDRTDKNLRLIEEIQRKKQFIELEDARQSKEKEKLERLKNLEIEVSKDMKLTEQSNSQLLAEIDEIKINMENLKLNASQALHSLNEKEKRNKNFFKELEELLGKEKTLRAELKTLKSQSEHEIFTERKIRSREENLKKELKLESVTNAELLQKQLSLEKIISRSQEEVNKRVKQFELLRKANANLGERLLDFEEIEKNMEVEENINNKILTENEILRANLKMLGAEDMATWKMRKEVRNQRTYQDNVCKNIFTDKIFQTECPMEELLPSSSENLSELERKIENASQKFEIMCSSIRLRENNNPDIDSESFQRPIKFDLEFSSGKKSKGPGAMDEKKLRLLTLDDD